MRVTPPFGRESFAPLTSARGRHREDIPDGILCAPPDLAGGSAERPRPWESSSRSGRLGHLLDDAVRHTIRPHLKIPRQAGTTQAGTSSSGVRGRTTRAGTPATNDPGVSIFTPAAEARTAVVEKHRSERLIHDTGTLLSRASSSGELRRRRRRSPQSHLISLFFKSFT